MAALSCLVVAAAAPAASPLRERPLPPPVPFRERPDVALADPAFEPLPGARAYHGRLGGAAFQIEVPVHWNGRLLLWMHGFEEFAAEAQVTAPDFRRFLISRGFAWGASSFSSTSLIPGRAADETAALWDHFARRHGRPRWTYVAGLSMGGWAAHIAAERYGDRFDGALGLCGASGTVPGLRIAADFLVAAAYVAGVTQAEFDAASDVGELIERRIRPALADPRRHARFEDIMIDLTGGPRAFAREGFHLEEETNWRRSAVLAAARLVPRRDTPYRLRPGAAATSEDFNRRAIRLRTDDEGVRSFTEGMDVTGRLRLPLLTLHSTGDGQVPIGQAAILRARVRAAGRRDLLVQRVIEDPSHCGFTTAEQEASVADLVRWVEQDRTPRGTNVAVGDLSELDRTFELLPRPGTPPADRVRGARRRAVVRGHASVDGAARDARWLGAVVRRNGLITPCQQTLPPIDAGRYEITVLAEEEASGCGRPGSEVLLWTFVDGRKLFSTEALAWPRAGVAGFDAGFASGAPLGAATATTDFSGEVYRRSGRRLPPGTRIEAFVGETRCGVASVRRTGNFGGYILSVVGPDAVKGCRSGARLRFKIGGRPAIETAVNGPRHSGPLDLTVRQPRGAR